MRFAVDKIIKWKYGTFGNSHSSAFYMAIDTQFDKDVCCGNCREGRQRKSSGTLEHVVINYLIEETEFLREEIKVKNKIIDYLFTLKLFLIMGLFKNIEF